ncbi:hypothetical protein [Microvirga thermotolerans]|uniref:hypothetical protein n=1 Tax=Microvirga thermotolerans TaxID=2651334 RepID=UPI00188470C7|nr:hypothetical protein [Microvirga thermotolerans]
MSEPLAAAFAVLVPEAPWETVDFLDVFHAAGVLSEETWRSKFEGEFGPLDLSTLPSAAAQESPVSPNPTG